jgi:hypothetical protein
MKAIEEIVQSYDPIKLDNIKRLLEREAQNGKPRYYEIYVDNLKVVEKTNDPAQFDYYEEFLYDGVKEIKVQRYTQSEAAPRVISRHIFRIGEEKGNADSSPMNGLGAIEIEAKINDKVSRERERWDCEQVKKELADTKHKLAEAEEYIDELTGIAKEADRKLEEAKTKSGDELAGFIKQLAPYAQALIFKKPMPSLSGTETKTENAQASFSRKSEPEDAKTTDGLSDDDKFYISFGRELEERFSDDELSEVILIVQALTKDKASIKPVAELLNIKK